LNEKRRASAREAHGNKKYTPRDLRAKSSKSHRRGLSRHQASLQTARVAKRLGNFRQRSIAVRA